MIHEEGKKPSEVSRKDEIFVSPSGLVSIAGGKLTGYRKMAERVVDLVMREFYQEEYKRFLKSGTENIPLSGGKIEGGLEMFFARTKAEYSAKGLDDESLRHLCGKYGSNVGAILGGVQGKTAVSIALAELEYCLHQEMTTSLADFLIRRTGRLWFEWDSVQELYTPLLEKMAGLLNWDLSQKNFYQEQFENFY